MPAWWDSAEAVGRIATWSQWIGVGLAFLAAIVGAISLAARSRRDSLLALAPRLAATERRQLPRVLSNEHAAQIAAFLRAGPQGPVRIVSVVGDAEAQAFASQLAAALANGGFTNDGVNQAIFTVMPVGLHVRIRSAGNPPRHAGRLQNALEAVGLHGAGSVNPELPEEVVELVVGTKPDN